MILKATYYKKVRRQPVGRNRRRGNKGVVFLPREFIGKRIKLTIEIIRRH
jgi:putative transposon-encoded protein